MAIVRQYHLPAYSFRDYISTKKLFFEKMDGDLYDEFGNYIGPELASDDEDENDFNLPVDESESESDEENDQANNV